MNMMVGESFFATSSTQSPAGGSLLPTDRQHRPDPSLTPAVVSSMATGSSSSSSLTSGPASSGSSSRMVNNNSSHVSATLSNAAAILSKMSSGGNKSSSTSGSSISGGLKADALLLPIWNMAPLSCPPPIPSLQPAPPLPADPSSSLPSQSQPPSSSNPSFGSSASSSLSSSSSSLPSVLSLTSLPSGGISNGHHSNSISATSSNNNNNNNSSLSGGSCMDIYTCQVSSPARVVFVPLPHSHMFEERTVDAGTPVKIGRAVARFKPSHNNAIFDCKVLSRNHALLWYENGRFLIQDTKSSNGTFVNNRRLSVANEESDPVEVTSGDVVQFGVDVVENQKRVTHGCISATLRLFLPGGEEVPVPDNGNSSGLLSVDGLPANGSTSGQDAKSTCAPAVISSSQLLQLTHCLKDALSREDFLEKKIHLLEQVVDRTREAADAGWKSLMQEDALLSKIESLQSKLESVLKSLSAKNADEETCHLRNEVQRLHGEREEYESTAKSSIMAHKERVLEAESYVQEMRIAVTSVTEEKDALLTRIEKMDADLVALADVYDKCKEELAEITAKHKVGEEEIVRLSKAGDQYQKQDAIDILMKERREKELDATRVKLSEAQEEITRLTHQVRELQEREETILFQVNDPKVDQEKDEEIDQLRGSVEDLMNQLNHANEKCDQMDEECQQIRLQHDPCQELISSLKSQVDQLQLQVNNSVSSFKSQSSFESPESPSSASPSSSALGSSSSYSEITSNFLLPGQEESSSAAAGQKTVTATKDMVTEQQLRERDQQLSDALSEVAALKDRVNDIVSNSEEQVQQLKSYIKCLESDLQEARVQMAITRSMSQASGRVSDDAETGEPADSPDASNVVQSTSHEPLQDNDSHMQEMVEKLSESLHERELLEDQVKCMKEDLENFRCQTKITSICAIVPLIMLVIAILIAFYPIVATVTGTTE